MTPGAALWSGREYRRRHASAALLKCRHPTKENGMSTKEERLKALEQKQERIRAQIQALKARDMAQERKDDTRRKVLIGGFVLAQLKVAGKDISALSIGGVAFTDTLTADRDRALFGLPPAAQAAFPAAAGGAAVSNEGERNG